MSEKLTITNSSLDSFTNCQTRYKYEVIDGWRHKISAPALSFGTLMHKCQENYWRCVQNQATKEAMNFSVALAIEIWRNERIDEFKKYAAGTGNIDRAINAILDPADKENIENMCLLATGIMERYIEKYAEKDKARFEVLAIEERIEFPLLTPKGNPSKFIYSGTLDLVLRDKRDGIIYVVDHKTTQTTNPQEMIREFPLKPQPKGYIWLAKQKWPNEVVNFIFDVIRKKVPAVPKPLQKKKDGRNLSIQAVDTLPEIFRAAIDEHDKGNEVAYADILQKLDNHGDTFLWRHEIFVSDRDLSEWAIERWITARSIGHARSGVGYSKNYNQCFAIGRPCPFTRVCLDAQSNIAECGEFEQIKHGGSPELEIKDEDELLF